MAYIVPPNAIDLREVERRRYPAILAELSPSAVSDEERDRTFARELFKTAALSSYHKFEQKFVEFVDELHALRALEHGWDTFEADPPVEGAIQRAEKALRMLKSLGALPAAVRPSSEGGVGICFTDNGGYAHLEFSNEGEADALAYSVARAPDYWPVRLTEAGLREAWDRIRASLQP